MSPGLSTAQTPPDDFQPAVAGQIHALAVLSDGKLLVGGAFTSLGGQQRTNLARLHADGSLDAAFDPRPSGTVYSLVAQADGRVLVGGGFSRIAGRLRDNIARLHPDGSLDGAFAGRTDGPVRALALQADGKVIVAGQFDTLNNLWCYSIGRLHPDGTKDSGFGFDSAGGALVLAVAVQPDGKVLMGGTFGRFVGGVARYRLARWNADGTLDYGFNAGDFSHNDASVDALAVFPDGKILAGGTFTNLAGRACYRIGRLTAGGGYDTAFGAGADGRVSAFALQADGKFIVAGSFTTMSGQARSRLARFNADGSLDSTFNPGASGAVNALALQADGKVLVSGGFTNLADAPRTNFARLAAAAPGTNNLARDATVVTWLHAGGGPEFARTAFGWTTNGTDWTPLGAGSPIPGGWQITNVAAPASATMRAQGFPTSGLGNGSGGALEDFAGPPRILAQPASRTNNAGSDAAFAAHAGGSTPLALQWWKGGAALGEGGKFLGTQTPTLTIADVGQADAGGYRLVASNSFGSVTSLVATLIVLDPGIATQPLSQNRELGETATLAVTPAGAAPFSFQWLKDGAALSGATADTLALTNLLATDAGRYTVAVCNSFGCLTSAPARLTVNAVTVDASFLPSIDGNPVYALAAQPDGKLLVGGAFTSVGGQARGGCVRLERDGSLDFDLHPGANGMVQTLALLPDRSLLLGGGFSTLGGATRYFFGKLTPAGVADSAFTNSPSGSVFALAAQPDGAFLVGGIFTTFAGQPRNYLARVNADGTLDSGFDPGANDLVYAFAPLPGGSVLVGGAFTTLAGQPRTSLARLDASGALDPAFHPDVASEDWTAQVLALAVQPDGKVLVGGTFSTLGGQPRANLARLNADGSLDASFAPLVTDEHVWRTPSVASVLLQADGKILLGGTFTHVAGQPRNALARLHADGSLDLTFNPVVGDDLPRVFGLTLQADGRVFVGGEFTSLAGAARKNLGLLWNTGPATDTLSVAGATITWRRGGTGPEVAHTTFERSDDGIAWTTLGSGARVAGGWEMTNTTVPPGGTLRARGFFAAGKNNSSGGFVERLLGAPVFTTQPVSQTNRAGDGTVFKLLATGPEPLSFQWLKDGLPLANGVGVSGATTDTLILSGLRKAAEGGYRLVVSNPAGSVTSLVATLTVIDPVVNSWPASRYAEPGQTVTFGVSAVGTALRYQWWKDGLVLPPATAATLVLTNVQLPDAGGYRVVVSNAFGSLTSGVATLTVNLATLEPNFNPALGPSVSAVAVQADGKILLGGSFTSFPGSSAVFIGRLNPSGTSDTTFNPRPNATVYALTVQPDGKILVGGDFTTLAGGARTALGRLNTNGTLDTSFSTTVFNAPVGSTLTARVQAILPQPDGRIVIGGRTSLNGGTATGFIHRLNTNGSTDTTFITTGGVNGPVATLAQQADGRIVAGGLFTTLRGQSRLRLGRIHADGTLDTSFTNGANGTVLALAVQADGRILVGGGGFTTVAGQPRTNLARLHADGSLDNGFAPAVFPSASGSVYSLAVQADGRIIVSGQFTQVGGETRSQLARLNADGSVDPGFNPGPNLLAYGVAIQPDGKLVVVGDFTQIAGQPRTRVARLNLPEPATQSLGYDGATLTWQRGGSSPEVGRVAFEFSANLTNWTQLGAGTRVAGGWQLDGLALLPAGRVRARGFVAGGAFNASTGLAETSLPVDPNTPPTLLTEGAAYGLSGQDFACGVAGLAGQVVVMEGSTNLAQWLTLGTNTLGPSPWVFRDAGAAQRPGRFYRARLR